jgi:hypothetical protein
MHTRLYLLRPAAPALAVALALAAGAAAPALAQPKAPAASGQPAAPSNPTPALAQKPEDVRKGLPVALGTVTADQEKRFWAISRARETAERDFNRIRMQHFQTGRKELRRAGIAKLRDVTDSALFPLLLTVFASEQRDVREAILDHLADLKTDDGDATLAWAAVHDKDEWFREQAIIRLKARQKTWTDVPSGVTSSVLAGFGSSEDATIRFAGNTAVNLKLYGVIPLLIQAQLGQLGAAPSGGGINAGVSSGSGMKLDDGSAIAWILIGHQIAYVSDLTPVTAAGAVAFDPQLSVVTEGVVIRVIDAVVLAYRVEIHNQLVALASDAAGKPMDKLGYDVPAWEKWYTTELQPQLAAKSAPAATAPSTTAPTPAPAPGKP